MNTDDRGVLCQVQLDGGLECGDGACWTGHYIYLTDAENWRFREVFEVGFGAWTRHPDTEMTDNGFGAFYKNPWNGCISRDQLTGILAGLLRTKDYVGVFRLILHHMCWLFLFSYNTIRNGKDFEKAKWKWPDFTGPDIWAMEIRALGPYGYVLYPLLWVFDIHIFLSTIYNLVVTKTDPINFALKLIVSKEHVPTPLSYLAFLISDKTKLMDEIARYWGTWRDQPEMIAFYKEKL